jgi:hypothetical protein
VEEGGLGVRCGWEHGREGDGVIWSLGNAVAWFATGTVSYTYTDRCGCMLDGVGRAG